ncbi:hypothetical protein Tco_0260000 [Tanacetum coccineum]
MMDPIPTTTNELLSKLLHQLGNLGLTANTNFIGPYLNTTSGYAVAFPTGPTVVAGPPAGLISPPGYPFQAQGCTCYLSGPFYPSKAQQHVTSITQAHQLGHGPLPAGSTHFTQQPGVMGPTQVSGHANTFPHAFTTETLRDFSNGV